MTEGPEMQTLRGTQLWLANIEGKAAVILGIAGFVLALAQTIGGYLVTQWIVHTYTWRRRRAFPRTAGSTRS